MHSTFIGREQQLTEVDRLIKARQGGVYAVKGNPGIGKSTLLRHIAELYKNKGQVFIDINDLPPLQTAVEFLQFFAGRAHGLKHMQEALAKINGTYKNAAELTAPYQSVLTDAGKLAADELSKDLDDKDKSKLSGIVSILWKLGAVLWGRKKESDKAKLGDPELFLLKALKKDCKRQPLIFIDTYERLQAASEISQQKISSRYSHPDVNLDPKNESITLQDWLERFLPFLQRQGAIIMIAGRKTGYWQAQAGNLDRFDETEILALAGSSQHADLQQAVAGQPQAVLSVLKQLSFDGIPLWLQLAINFVCFELDNGKTISELAEMSNLNDYFAIPVSDADLKTTNIEHASCKLALFKRVMQHNQDIEDRAWQMALPRRLDKGVLRVLFAEQAEALRDAFINAGLLPAIRIESDEQDFRLHYEIRDLLLAYALYQKWVETEEIKTLHKKLADFFTHRYQLQPQIQWLLERLYHQLMLEEDADLGHISEPQLLVTMAMDLQAEKQYVKMGQVFLRLIEMQSDHEDAWFGLGFALGQQGRLDEAVVAYQEQIKVKPDDASAWNNLGNALGKLGRLDEAVAAYQEQIKVKPDDASAWYNLGIALGRQGRLDEAVAAYQEQIKVSPDHASAWYNLGNALGRQGRLDEAVAAYQEQIKVKPDDASAWYNLGLALVKQGRLDEAVAAYQEQIKVKPDDANAWYNLGNALGKQGRLDEAVAAYQEQIKVKPDDANAWYNLGNALGKQGRLDEAVAAYQEQIKVKPDHASARYNLGNALGRQGRLDEAVAAYQEQIKVSPEDEDTWNNLGVALGRQGKLDEAELAYAQALQFNPQNLSALCNDAELALVQQDTRRCRERIQQAMSCADNKTQEYAILLFLAWLAEPEESHQRVLDAIQNLDPAVKIAWDFSTTEPAIARLNPEQQLIARQIAAYFEGKSHDLPGL